MMLGTMMNYPLTLPHILERAGKFFPQTQIVSRRPDRSLHRYTYADFYRRARALANALQAAGLNRGDRVATLMWNHHAHLEAYFGIPVSSGVLHTLNLRLAPSEIAYIANHAGDRFLIVDDVLLPLFEKFRENTKFERVIVVRWNRDVTGNEAANDNTDDYEKFLTTATGTFEYPELDENEAASMCYTSGTTGMPKGVVYSHRSVVLHAFLLSTVDNFAVCNRDTVLPAVSMFHVNGWALPYTGPFVGAKLVLPGPHLDPESLLSLCEEEGVTVAAAVPTVWLNVIDCLEKNPDRWKVPRMRILIGGAAPPLVLIRKLHQHGMSLEQGWGLTESSPQATTPQLKAHMQNWPDEEKHRIKSLAGIPVPFVDRRVVNPESADPCREVPWDGTTMGEVQLRGPWVAARYYNLAAEKDKWTPDGWFRTGDVGTVDAEGYLKIVDRTKDLIKSGGEWISSVDLENALVAHPDVREAAVIAVAHPKWQERPVAIVVLRDGAQLQASQLREFLSHRFAKWQLPDSFIVVEELPHTSTGKLLKTELRRRFQEWKWEE